MESGRLGGYTHTGNKKLMPSVKTVGQQGLIYMYPHGKWNDAKSDAIIIAKDMLKTSNGQWEDGRLYPHGI